MYQVTAALCIVVKKLQQQMKLNKLYKTLLYIQAQLKHEKLKNVKNVP